MLVNKQKPILTMFFVLPIPFKYEQNTDSR